MNETSSAGPAGLRTVAIVGRPNVGKSAIFNRLAGRRIAIVHEEAGVTRDRLVAEARWDDRAFTLVDTGGIGMIDRARTEDAIVEGTRRQVDVAIADAALVLMVVDVQAGLLPLDAEVARLLREHGRPVLVAANKSDHPHFDGDAAEFARFGYPVFPVSASHNRGFDDLMAEALRRLPPGAPEAGAANPLVVTVAGRPNAGKSSYINRLLHSDRLIVSPVPGTTRDSVEVPFAIGEGPEARHYLLIDTAGMRPARKVDTAVEKFSLIRVAEAVRRADICVLMLDAAEGPSRQDKKIADLVLEHRKGCLVLVNKWDLAQGISPKDYEEAFRREVPFLNFAPLQFVSARTGHGIQRSIAAVDLVAAQISTTFTTGLLNRMLQETFERKSPPSVRGRRLKLYYATQTGTRPLRLRLFVNDPDLRVPSYSAFIERRLRETFGLEGAPLNLQFVARKRPGE